MRLDRPHRRGLLAHVTVDPRGALEDRASYQVLLTRLVDRHSCHAAFCNKASSFSHKPATAPSMPTGLSSKSTARKTHTARYDPARVGWLWSLSCRTGWSCLPRNLCQA